MTMWIDKELLERRVILQQTAVREHPKYTPDCITELAEGEIFVFGNLEYVTG